MKKIPLILSCSLAAATQAAEHVTYEEFGAVGDGRASLDADGYLRGPGAATMFFLR